MLQRGGFKEHKTLATEQRPELEIDDCPRERKTRKMSTRTINAETPLPRTGRLWSIAPWLSRLIMFPPVLVFSLISIRFLSDPGHATPGVTLNTPEAFTDTRVIGAWMLTLLTLLITFLISEDRLWLGHLQLACFMGVTLVVRIFGFINDGTTLAMGNQRTITIVEIVFLTLNVLGLVVQTRVSKQSGVR
jgi:hypothetical protein